MPKSIPLVVKRTVLATAVLSLSACSSMPPVTEITLGDVGGGIAKAGKATADAGRKTWQKTTYLLGFSDEPGKRPAANSDEQLLSSNSDAVQVMPIADMPAIGSADSNRPVLVQQATAGTSGQALTLGGDNLSADNASAPALNDLIHEVSATETLWDIAKKTTGNANNWHELADVNNLGQNATVFPGQELVIPANLRRQDEPVAMASTETIGSNLQDASEQIDQGANTRLVIPAPADIASATSDVVTSVPSGNRDAESFEVQSGETLWDFAKRTTGDATNWKAIAKHNMFTEKQAVTVREGQTIFVPQKLVTDYREAAANAERSAAAVVPAANATNNAVEAMTAAAVATPVEDIIASVESAPASSATQALSAASESASGLSIEAATALTQQPIDSTGAQNAIVSALPSATALENRRVQALELAEQTGTELAGNAASVADETQDIKIVEATYKTDEALDTATLAEQPAVSTQADNVPSEIMVSGTYYPKAVYNNADFSSSLLMRVSPGTTLQVSRAMGTWFEVETDKGVGYVHQRDIQ